MSLKINKITKIEREETTKGQTVYKRALKFYQEGEDEPLVINLTGATKETLELKKI